MSDYGIPIMISSRSRLAALLLAIFVGFLGIHRFYAGKVITGIIWLLTGGLLGVGVIIDIILIAIGVFRDKAGLVIQRW
jgi:TM2 domain-containing membrane protein YozV